MDRNIKDLETTVNKKKMGDESVAATRGGFRGKKYTEDVRLLVKYYINSVPHQQSHYGPKFSEKEYLSGVLSFVSLHAAFKEKCSKIDVSVDFYTKVFNDTPFETSNVWKRSTFILNFEKINNFQALFFQYSWIYDR